MRRFYPATPGIHINSYRIPVANYRISTHTCLRKTHRYCSSWCTQFCISSWFYCPLRRLGSSTGTENTCKRRSTAYCCSCTDLCSCLSILVLRVLADQLRPDVLYEYLFHHAVSVLHSVVRPHALSRHTHTIAFGTQISAETLFSQNWRSFAMVLLKTHSPMSFPAILHP